MKKDLPQVVLVGRINAGKSTLFNTLTETSQAIVSSSPGTTRDLNFSDITWRDKSFILIDTGGLDAARLGRIESYVQKKAYQAVKKANLVLLVMDGQQELTAEDKKIARIFKKNKKKVLLVVNKVDGSKIRQRVTPDFYKLGLGKPTLVSAVSGVGTGDLLDLIIQTIPHRQPTKQPADLRLSIIGKTNVGKSSLLNAILGTERVLVTPLPHTTREPQDILLKYKEKNILLVDTAGLRKKRKVSDEIEKVSVEKTLEAIKKSDISLLVTDASQPLTNQDQNIAQLARQNNNGIIIVVNKWDLIKEKTPTTINKFTDYYRRYLPWLLWAPIIFTTALEKQRIRKIIDLALKIKKERDHTISEKDLATITREVTLKKAKPGKGKKSAPPSKFFQTYTNPPTFTLLNRHPDRINPAYLNLLEKKMRSKYGFIGTPIIINLQKK
jgi:GTP-binding protein